MEIDIRTLQILKDDQKAFYQWIEAEFPADPSVYDSQIQLFIGYH